MGFILRSLKVIMILFIFYTVMSILYSRGINFFGAGYYTELGFVTFMTALFLEATLTLHK